jgi:hypothetical protein
MSAKKLKESVNSYFPKFIIENRFLLIVLLFTVLMRLLTPQMILTGGEDAADTWIAAKWILYGNDYVWNHTTARFGTIIPVFITQYIFGTSPIVYYIAPAVFQIILILFLFKLSEQLIHKNFAIIVCTLFLIFPESVIAGSHPRTSTFSMTFLVISVYYLFKYFRAEHKGAIKFLIISSASAFCMYLSNELTLFFLPGFALSILLARKGIKAVSAFTGIFILLFAVEFLLYAKFSPFPMGRLQIATQNHLGEGGRLVPVEGILQLLNRFSPSNVSLYWTIIIPLFLLFTIYLFFRKKDSYLKYAALIDISFIFFITFTVKGIHPLTPIVNFRMRYLADLTPLIILVFCGIVFYLAFSSTHKAKPSTAELKTIISASCLICTGIIASMLVYTNKYYKHSNYFSVYPLSLVSNMYTEINNEFAKGTPIVIRGKYQYNKQSQTIIDAVQKYLDLGLPLNQALVKADIPMEAYLDMRDRSARIYFIENKMFERFFWDERRFSENKPPRYPVEDRFSYKNRDYVLYSSKPVVDKSLLMKKPYVIELDIKPFRSNKISFAKIVRTNTGASK